jgi:hypothetical protein
MVSPPAPDAEASPTCKDVSRPENLRPPYPSASACAARPLAPSGWIERLPTSCAAGSIESAPGGDKRAVRRCCPRDHQLPRRIARMGSAPRGALYCSSSWQEDVSSRLTLRSVMERSSCGCGELPTCP